ncbi:hypothetical protein [Microcoleus sp. CAWBG58]|nr:hypothetical protein [Microcoleus sp. CAWBG58]
MLQSSSIDGRGSCQLSTVNCQLMKTATNFTRNNWFKARAPIGRN